MKDLPGMLGSADDELWSLVAAYCDGNASAEQLGRLNDRLASDDDARRFYLGYLQVHSELAWLRRGAHDASVAPQQTGLPVLRLCSRAWSTINHPLKWSILTVGVIFYGLFALISWDLRPAPQLSQHQAVPLPPIVATMHQEDHVIWSSEHSDHPLDSARIRAHEQLKISSGRLSLQLTKGVRLWIEGPAEWTIDSDNLVTLASGHLVARVPKQAIGFVLKTPSARIVDLGTEFSVTVDDSHATNVQVHEGRVDVYPQGHTSERTRDAISLSAGQARRVSAPSARGPAVVSNLAYRAATFAETGRVPQRFATLLDRWRQWSNEFRRDPTLVAYYDFERDEAAPDKLLNRALVTSGVLDGDLGTGTPDSKPTWTGDGRWRGKGALHFDSTIEQMVTVPDTPETNLGNQFSIAAWVRPDKGFLASTVAAKRNVTDTGYQFGLWGNQQPRNHPERAYRLQFQATPVEGGPYALVMSDRVLPIGGSWMHVAMTRDNSEVTFYFNGQAVGVTTIASPSKVIAAPLHIGGEHVAGGAFRGYIDELAIFDRVLSAEEINFWHEAGRIE